MKEQPTEQQDSKIKDFEQEHTKREAKNKKIENKAILKGEMDHDVEAIIDFIDTVFHVELEPDEHVLTWAPTGKLSGFPSDVAQMEKVLNRSKKVRSLYFGTATCTTDPETGGLFNRKSLFKRLHAVVLDDIGEKVPVEKLPIGLDPTYIIESSEGSYQYGFVFEEPIASLEQATALIQLVYASGYTDAGGKMPTKIVRLPGGVNGKEGPKQMFPVTLHKIDGPRWTPEKLLDVLDLGVTWAEIQKDASLAEKRKGKNMAGATPWAPKAESPTLDGVIDPVLEWLYEENMVYQELHEWITIECPWCDDHTTGGNTAGYSPIGHGAGSHSHYRGFKCFHEHCGHRTGRDFLEWVASQGGPEAAVNDLSGELLAQFAYDPVQDCAWDIRGDKNPTAIPLKGFNNLYGRTVIALAGDGKPYKTTAAKMWMASPYRVDVYNQTLDPARPERLVEVNGLLAVNTFKQPRWGDGDIDQDDLEMWLEFIEYLVPVKEERDYFLDWLAAKAQNMGFRGAAILMVAPQQGTGRTTLSDMLATLFDPVNTAHVPFPDLVREGGFNEWQEKPIVFTDETLAISGTGQYRVYETLKELLDFRPKATTINPKYSKKRVVDVHSSYLMFSNHVNALAAKANDRRIFVIENAHTPWPAEKFNALNKWLHELDEDGKPFWAKSVWRWLQKREVDLAAMLEPAPITNQKRQMLDATASLLDIAVRTVVDNYPLDLLNPYDVKAACLKVGHRIEYTGDAKTNKIINHIIRDHTSKCHDSLKVRAGGRAIRPKLIKNAAYSLNHEKYCTGDIGLTARGRLSDQLEQVDIDYLAEKINETLDLLDM
jgi:hypothetical protein